MIRAHAETKQGGMKRPLAVAVAASLAAGFMLAALAPAAPNRTTGELRLNASFEVKYRFGDYCPPGTPADVLCVRFLGEAAVPGLGRATATYVKTVRFESADCPVTQFRTASITVAGKGEIFLSVPRNVCGQTAPAGTGPFEVRITGGSGAYADASGTLEFRSNVFRADATCGPCGKGRDTWTGVLNAPGLDFDLATPALSGVGSRTVKALPGAKRIRVRFTVTAEDAIDGSVPVVCAPRSGSFFSLGRTRVTCSATDSSQNTRRGQFTITVR